jgi:hypothetical protein
MAEQTTDVALHYSVQNFAHYVHIRLWKMSAHYGLPKCRLVCISR